MQKRLTSYLHATDYVTVTRRCTSPTEAAVDATEVRPLTTYRGDGSSDEAEDLILYDSRSMVHVAARIRTLASLVRNIFNSFPPVKTWLEIRAIEIYGHCDWAVR